ncbi:MAG: zinc ribbon domain-containing protein [Anaerovoracaceae bacterium]
METKNIIHKLRTEKGLSQDELAKKIFVTRQAVSRWENNETVPNTEALKLLSKEFDVSINTLLGSPRQLFCQCCGMPLDDLTISKEIDGEFNEDYCKWCYTDGQFAYRTKEDLIEYLLCHMPNTDNLQEEERRVQFDCYLSQLKHWK